MQDWFESWPQFFTDSTLCFDNINIFLGLQLQTNESKWIGFIKKNKQMKTAFYYQTMREKCVTWVTEF